MNAVHVSAELAPWARTGGLGDVASALPRALAQHGARAVVYAPMYARVRRQLRRDQVDVHRGPGFSVPIAGGWTAGTSLVEHEGVTTVFVEHHSFDRDGLYGDANGTFGDNDCRFALLSLAALETADAVLGAPVDVFHAHDWHTGLLPHYRKRYAKQHAHARTVFTIHNLAYQGVFGASAIKRLCLDDREHHPEGYEWHTGVNFMKSGIGSSDVVTTVSPRYATEILKEAGGFGLHGYLRKHAHKLVGVLNGLDITEWDPSGGRGGTTPYTAATVDVGKQENRAALMAEFDMQDHGRLLVGVVSRLTAQKGLDLLADLVPHLPKLGAQVVLLGSGDPKLEARLRRLAQRAPAWLAVRIGFDVGLAHRVMAGSDVTAIPSRFEPCGLTQMQGMRYGTLPVVHATGGLADTVDHDQTGFVFDHPTAAGLGWALHVAARTRREQPEHWAAMRQAAMARDVSWTQSAERTLALYRGER
jgi:starch synthase